MNISVGIIALNEEKNISKLLESLLTQKTNNILIDEIIVVSSGSTDTTNEIVKEYSNKNSKIKLINHKERKGKASAVNEFIKTAKNKILVMESGDTIPEKETVKKLCLPFFDKDVGMVGAHPKPTDNINTFMGYTTHLLWDLHHKVSMKNPKGGEMIAFKKLFNRIPEDIAVDEAWIEYEIKRRGYKLAYSPEAIVYNKGPEIIREFLRQRRRVVSGHRDLQKRTNYKVSTIKISIVVTVLLRTFPYTNPKRWLWFFSAMVLEALGRVWGYWDYAKKKRYAIWEVTKTTKEVKILDQQ